MKDTPELGKLISGETRRDAVHIAVAPVTASEKLKPGQHIKFVDYDGGNLVCNCHPHDQEAIGIVDPFLTEPVKEGQQFWMFLYPNTITSLRHVWTHPAFKPSLKVSEEVGQRQAFLGALALNPHDEVTRKIYADWLDERGEHEEAIIQRTWTAERQKQEDEKRRSIEVSKAWLTSFAHQCDVDYDTLMERAQYYVDHGEDFYIGTDTPDIAYTHYEEFWDHFDNVMGSKVPEFRRENFIRCAC